MRLALLIALPLLLGAQVRDLGPAVILGGDFGDPSIVRDGSDFYMVHSTGGVPAFRFWHSTDLYHWKPLATALNKTYNPWAADLVKYGNLFYLYDYGGGTNYVMTAPHPRGPWSAPIDLNVKGIDPGHIATPEGRRYLYLEKGSVAELAPDGLSAAGPKHSVYSGWPYPEDWTVECPCLESPKLFFHDGYYYMVSAQGGTVGPSTSHMAIVARSRSPLGSWENSPVNPLLRTHQRSEPWWSKGHGTILDDGHGNWFVVYHALQNGARRLGRQTLIEPLDWRNGWPMRRYPDGAGFHPKVIPNWQVAPDDFSAPALGPQWQLQGTDTTEPARISDGRFHLTAAPKAMRMLAVKISDLDFEAEMEFDVKGEAEVGLILNHGSGYLGIGLKAGQIVNPTGSIYRYGAPLPCARCRFLRFRLRNNEMTMFYGTDGKNWQRYPRAYDIDLFTGFGGLKIGMYAVGSGELVVDRFTYRAKP